MPAYRSVPRETHAESAGRVLTPEMFKSPSASDQDKYSGVCEDFD